MSTLMAKGIEVGAYEIKDYWIGIEYIEDLNCVLKRLNNQPLVENTIL
jgi:hypothetical protein